MKTYTKGKKTKGAEKTPALTKGAPRIVDEHSWFYIDRKGLLIVHEAYAVEEKSGRMRPMQNIDLEKKKGRSHFRGTAQVYGRNLETGLTKSPINKGFSLAALPIYASPSKNDSGTCTEKRAESVQCCFPSVLPVPS